jgi:hypothetical protein
MNRVFVHTHSAGAERGHHVYDAGPEQQFAPLPPSHIIRKLSPQGLRALDYSDVIPKLEPRPIFGHAPH